MTPQRWQEIEQLVQEALQTDPAVRGVFLDRRCAGDPGLRQEVESFISSAQPARNFLNRDAWQDAAEFITGADLEPLVGRQIGHYVIQKLIGAGGVGEVYLAEDLRLTRRVALKLLDPTLDYDSNTRARFIREARLAAALDHPNICTIHEVGEMEGRPFIAMQFIEGKTFKDLIGGKPLNLEKLISLSLKVANALAAAHARGIIHCDIKSQNIMVTSDDQVKVLDFGLAKLLEPDAAGSELELTRTGEVKGTPSSMSPEQARGEHLDQRSDIFSLGVVLYEMATGRKPFAGKTRVDVISALLKDPHRPALELNHEIPPKLSAVIDRALAKKPDDRYQSMGNLIADLNQAASETEGLNHFSADSSGNASVVIATRRKIGILKKLPDRIALVVFAVIALSLAILGFGLSFSRREQPASASPIKSIAVLPFKPLVAENRDEALEMGVADTLIARLSNIKEIEVRPISAVRRYGGLDQDPGAAGREQTVDAVLDGSIQKVPDRVRVTVHLMRVRDGATLWTDTFDDKLTDILAVEDSISARVAEMLAVKLTGEEKALVAQHSTNNPEAYQLYLKGRYFWSKRTGESIKTSVDYFNQAIARDPNYALAYAGLAESYLLLSNYNVTTPQEAYSKARAAALEALNRDEKLADAHVALAGIKKGYDWDFAGAEREYRRAIELNPNDAWARYGYGEHLALLGRSSEALAEMRRAQELEPLSLIINTELCSVLYFAGLVDEAIDQGRKTLDLEPRHVRGRIELGFALRQKRLYQEAIAEFKKALEVDGEESYAVSQLALTYGMIGEKKEAEQAIERLQELSKRHYVLPSDMAAAYVGLGDKDRVFEWLEKAYRDRDDGVVFLNIDPSWDSVRSDERFRDLVRRVGLPQ